VVIPINRCQKSKMLEINDGYWKLDGKDIPIAAQVYKWQDPLHLCKVIIFASIPFCNVCSIAPKSCL
jgi:hypothetical protein